MLLGSLVAAVLLTLGGYLLGLYMGASRFSSAFEAAGAVAVFLMTFYFIGQIVVLGAVFTRVYASVRGSPIRPRGEPSPDLPSDTPPADGDGQPPETPKEREV